MRRFRYSIALCTCLLLSVAALSTRAGTLTVGALNDNTMYSESDTLSNGAGQRLFAGKNGLGDTRRGLIRFDVSAIPMGASVDSVVLQLYLDRTLPGSSPVELHRVLADWGEGTSVGAAGEGGGGPATPGDATWGQRFFGSAQPWGTPGGDFAAGASASRSVGAVAFYTWSSAALASDVSFWMHNPSLNDGWIVIGDETSNGTAKGFATHENSTVSNRPSLTIYYTEATAAESLTPAVRLLPARPNPFNPTTTLQYQLPRTAHARIAIYNAGGKLVRVLVDDVVESGLHEVRWNGRNAHGEGVASGVYLVRLQTPGVASQVQKIVLLK